LDQKQLLMVIFPDELSHGKEGFWTAVTSPLFSILAAEVGLKTIMAPQTIDSWNQITSWLYEIDLLRQTSPLQAA